MLVIRMQRTGRSGHAQFRVVVQDSRRTPTSGKVVAQLGHFDPHSKQTSLNKEKAQFYLEHGAQPSDRVARLLKSEGLKLPKWVNLEGKKKGAIRNPEKLRRNRPAGEPAPEKTEAPVEKPVATEDADSKPAEAETKPESTEAPAEATEPEVPGEAEASANRPAEEAAPAEENVISTETEKSPKPNDKNLSAASDGSAQDDKENTPAEGEKAEP